MLFALLGRYDPHKMTEVHTKENEVFEMPSLDLKVKGCDSTDCC